MFIAVDIGNTKICFGVMEEKNILFSSALSTDWHKTGDEYAVIIRDILHIHGISTGEIEGGIISSVVPAMKKTILNAIESITGKKCMIVGPGLKNGLKIRIDDPAQLGGDSVCNAVAVIQEYQTPAIIIDMGTATTISVIDGRQQYRGGLILPGAIVSLDALTRTTSQLPQISPEECTNGVIGSNTVDCMKNGFLYGNAAMLDGVIDRICEELGEQPFLIATGDAADLIIPACRNRIVVDSELMLKGLRIIYQKNCRVRESVERK